MQRCLDDRLRMLVIVLWRHLDLKSREDMENLQSKRGNGEFD